MKILAVDTALAACSVAVLDGEGVLAHELVAMERGHAEALAPMVQGSMHDAGLRFAELDRLAVTTGPGTFTGQRVGLAFMRGLRLALRVPLVGITTLEAMSAAALSETRAEVAAVLHDAKRGEVYAGIYTRENAVIAPTLLPLEEAVAEIQLYSVGCPLALAGTASKSADEQLRASGNTALPTDIVYPDALWVARLALHAPAPDGPPRPLYLRPPDARLPSAPPV